MIKVCFLKILILTVLCIMTVVQAADGTGYHGATFLRISPAARQVAMGEASAALADDINLLRYNVGGLGNLAQVQLSTSFHNWIDDTQQGAIALALPTGVGVFGFDFSYFNEGKIIELDEYFRQTGGISYSNDILMTMAYGNRIKIFHKEVAVGGAFKIIRQNLVGQQNTVTALDLGTCYNYKRFSFAAAFQNLGLSKPKFEHLQSPIAQCLRFGIGARFDLAANVRFNIATDLAWTPREKVRSYWGGELTLSELISLRSGFNVHDVAVAPWSAGFGLNMPMQWLADSRTRFDYAYSPMGAFDMAAHRFSLVFTFGVLAPVSTVMDERLRRELDEAERARLAAQESEARARQLEQEIQDRLSRIKQIAEESQGKIEVQPKEANKILVSMRINFDFDKADIRPEEVGTMHQVGEILNTYPEAKVHISGHTDYIGTEEYNISLSQRRIDSVMVFLGHKEQVDMNRFYMPIGYGELKPIDTNSTEEGRFRNRRVEFLLFTFDAVPEIPDGSAVMSVEMTDDSSVRIICNGKVNFTVQNMSEPDRLIIDFPGIFLLSDAATVELNRGPFLRVRLGFHPAEQFTRVVLDLTQQLEVDVQAVDNVVVVKLKN
jgi:outer membrane protein OmpA-like peptidoglycan-associated protein